MAIFEIFFEQKVKNFFCDKKIHCLKWLFGTPHINRMTDRSIQWMCNGQTLGRWTLKAPLQHMKYSKFRISYYIFAHVECWQHWIIANLCRDGMSPVFRQDRKCTKCYDIFDMFSKHTYVITFPVKKKFVCIK